jgi:predicted nucleic acid-binding protein
MSVLTNWVPRARQARERRLSLTDCVSFEVMLAHGCRAAIANDEHFRRNGFPSLNPNGVGQTGEKVPSQSLG